MEERERNRELADQGDVDALVRRVDELCDARAWDALVDLRTRSAAAVERGHQLWPVASLCDYRLALEAPGEWAGAVLREGGGRFALGPLTEVAAATHPWDELREHIPPGPLRAVAAQERILRGDDLTEDPYADLGVLELPGDLQRWEPHYALATYHRDRVETPTPAAALGTWTELPAAVAAASDPIATDALLATVRSWVDESEGRAAAVAVEADAPTAIATLGHHTVRLAQVPPDLALAHLASAAASGGAHGRRRGAAAGRFDAWWALAAVGGVLDDWPVSPDELGEVAGELRWSLWSPDAAGTGWQLHLAVEDPDAGLAWALSASDPATATANGAEHHPAT